jgi:hypothetical protein
LATAFPPLGRSCCAEVSHMLLITSTATRCELAEAIGHLRAKRRHVRDAVVLAEIDEDVDQLVEAWGRAR